MKTWNKERTDKLIDLMKRYGSTERKKIAEHFPDLRYDQVSGKISRVLSTFKNIEFPTESIPSINESYKYDNLEALDEIITKLEDQFGPIERSTAVSDNVAMKIPVYHDFTKKSDACLTLVFSDLHLGDSDHLNKTYWSTINNLKMILARLRQLFNIKVFRGVANGDIVSGRGIYKGQEYRNLVDRGHWQVTLAYEVINETIEEINEIIPIDRFYLIRGTHEPLEENYIMYLKKFLSNAYYLGHSKVINIAYPISSYNVLFTHGMGSSQYHAVSNQMILDAIVAVNQYKREKIDVQRIVVGHTHQLEIGHQSMGLTFDISGGFQRWEKTVAQRDPGMILYLFTEGTLSIIPIVPDPNIVMQETESGDLEFNNMLYYATMLKKSLVREKEFSDQKEEII
jgi:hypothetical protein